MAKLKSIFYNTFVLSYILGGLIAIIISNVYGFNREVIGVVILLGAIIPFFLQIKPQLYNQICCGDENYSVSNFNKIAFIIWLCLSLLSVVISSYSKNDYHLPLIYFIVIVSAILIISLQIFHSNGVRKYEVYLILFEIILISLIIATSYIYLFPEAYGNDSSYHVNYITSILESGNIGNYEGYYVNYPFYHILYSNTLLISNTSIKFVQFMLAFVQIIFLLFIFTISNRLFNHEIALLSTLLASISTNLIVPRYMHFPGTFTSIFFVLIIFLYFSQYVQNRNDVVHMKSLLIFSFLALVFSHPLTPAITIGALFTFFVTIKLLKFTNIKFNVSLMLITIILTIMRWMQTTKTGQNLFSNFVLSIKNAFEKDSNISESVSQATLTSLYDFKEILLYDLGFVMILFLGIIGAFLILKLYYHNKFDWTGEKRFVLAVTTLVFVPIPYALAIVYPQSLPARWFPFIEIFSTIFAGVALYSIFQNMKNSNLKYVIHLMIIFIVFFSITSPIANPNNHIYSTNVSTRAALMQSEINAANFVNTFIDESTIRGNSKYLHFINRDIANTNHFINPLLNQSYQKGTIVIRDEDLDKGFIIPLYGSKNKLLDIISPNDIFNETLNGCNNMYYNKEVNIYNCN